MSIAGINAVSEPTTKASVHVLCQGARASEKAKRPQRTKRLNRFALAMCSGIAACAVLAIGSRFLVNVVGYWIAPDTGGEEFNSVSLSSRSRLRATARCSFVSKTPWMNSVSTVAPKSGAGRIAS
jgi:hypothetical protein